MEQIVDGFFHLLDHNPSDPKRFRVFYGVGFMTVV